MGNICQQKEDIGIKYFNLKIIKALIQGPIQDDPSRQGKEVQARVIITVLGTIIRIKGGIITEITIKDGAIVDHFYSPHSVRFHYKLLSKLFFTFKINIKLKINSKKISFNRFLNSNFFIVLFENNA